MTWLPYKGLMVVDPATTTGPAGTNLSNDLIHLADRTSGTAGSVIFVDASTTFLTEDNARFSWDDSNARLRINTTSDFTAAMNVVPKVAADKALVLRGAASQSANLFEAQDSSGNLLTHLTSDGILTADTTSSAGGVWLNDSRTFSSSTSLSRDANFLGTALNWSSAFAGTLPKGVLGLGITDNRTLTATSTNTDTVVGIELNINRNASTAGATGLTNLMRLSGIRSSLVDNGAFNPTTRDLTVETSAQTIQFTPSFSVNTSHTVTYNQYGFQVIANSTTPTLTAGTLNQNHYGFYASFAGNTVGTSTGYGFYANVSGYDTNWAFYNGSSAAHNLLGKDNVFTYFGTNASASITYDGTNLVINPKVAGSGALSVTGNLSIADANDVVLGTGTGTKIGTGTSQKLAFYNATPAAQPANTVAIDTLLETLGLRATGGTATFDNDIKAGVAGKGLYVKEGTNATMGVAALSSGSATVSTSKVTTNSRIFLTNQSPSGTVGTPYVSARTAGTSFTITSTSGSDTSTVAWIIIEPA